MLTFATFEFWNKHDFFKRKQLVGQANQKLPLLHEGNGEVEQGEGQRSETADVGEHVGQAAVDPPVVHHLVELVDFDLNDPFACVMEELRKGLLSHSVLVLQKRPVL